MTNFYSKITEPKAGIRAQSVIRYLLLYLQYRDAWRLSRTTVPCCCVFRLCTGAVDEQRDSLRLIMIDDGMEGYSCYHLPAHLDRSTCYLAVVVFVGAESTHLIL